MSENVNVNQNQDPSEPVLDESKLPVVKKPSVQYMASMFVGVVLIIVLAVAIVNGYFGS
ncbi:hypothetical protein PCC7424_2008 [Gloeothece citriformis PCC 7424]|uniref:Uncharacterized protein n=1 Tax=Gloeothece citriformis (strain PCC 7424) TaxID=65393 RepID=B7KEY2_GLOC7|nr:hypothetical protein [Gloeothece citriformis]ACK70438.1 hypothetical protein PCC7424_2008 [Gloeothece citriformis PCC 7424]